MKTIYDMLISEKSGVAVRAICFCVANGRPAAEEIQAIQNLIDGPNRNERIANRPMFAYARAALHVLGTEVYDGTDMDIIDAIIMLTCKENLEDMRSCDEYKMIYSSKNGA